MKTSASLLLLLLGSTLAGGCSVGAHVAAGYTQVAVSGDLGLTTGTGGVSNVQDIEPAFGLGDDQGSPYVRAEADLGFARLTGSAFRFEESGEGVIDGAFGNIPSGTQTRSNLEFTNVKASLGFDFGLGPVSISPGLALDVFDMQFVARDPVSQATEEFDDVLFLPLLNLGAEVELFGIAAAAEIGYLKTPEIDNAETEVLDFEAMLRWDFGSNLGVFAGYRYIDLQGEGETGGDSVDVNFQVSGWTIGGMLRF
jgi:hypothetical protein